jgi:hypothetical protein
MVRGEFCECASTTMEAAVSEAKRTRDHDEIRKWAQARNGHPARVRGQGEGGLLRIDFGKPEERLEPIEWDEFFQIFDDNNLDFLFQDKTSDGKESRFNKFVEHEGAGRDAHGQRAQAGHEQKARSR